MEVSPAKLIPHEINCNELIYCISPNVLKDEKLEWNKEENSEHQFSEDITNSDLVITIENIDEPYEEYAYFFFEIKIAPAGNKIFRLNKAVFDENLTDDFIEYCIAKVLDNLVCMDYSTTDRIFVTKNQPYPYPLAQTHISDTKQKVTREIIDRYYSEKTGRIHQKYLDRIQKKTQH